MIPEMNKIFPVISNLSKSSQPSDQSPRGRSRGADERSNFENRDRGEKSVLDGEYGVESSKEELERGSCEEVSL
jgi:hypothetical protein